MPTPRASRVFIAPLICCLVLLGAGATFHTQASASASTPTGSLRPALSTSCPAPGTARAAVMPPLTLGSHPSIVYLVNEGTPSHPTFGTLKRYDVVTGAKVEVVKLANASISGAQVSANGQWLLFVAQVSGQVKLQLVRMDGQDLQTLYCGSGNPQGSIANVQWSATQQLVVFAQSVVGGSDIDLLNLTTGVLQVELPAQPTRTLSLRTWLDTTRVYLTLQLPDSAADRLYLLDTSKGPNQQMSDLLLVFDASSSTPFCWDFDSSFDASKLFVSQCTTSPVNHPGAGPAHGPSVITVHPPAGGSSYTYLYVDQGLAFKAIRAVITTTLLFLVGNESGNTSQNGLWKVGTDGSHPKRLTTSGELNQFTQFPWSNASRDGSRYALQIVTATSSSTTYTLEYGSLAGGAPVVFASIINVQLATVGWTTT